MSGMSVSVLAAAAVIAAAFLYFEYRERRLLNRLSRMLDAAAEGDFSEKDFDESMLSALETRMVRFLEGQRTASKKLEEDRDKIKTLISDISHQTKTPVANIILYAQLLEEAELPKESGQLLQALEGQAVKLTFLIDNLVKMSRLESGIIQVKPHEQAVQLLLEDVKGQIAPAAEKKGIRLHFEKTQDRAVFDEKWTAEALYNLLSNAVKYTAAGGSVSVFTESYQYFVRIEVRDTGIGIAEEEQARVFARFYRSEEAAEEEGVGIGLYLAREIIQEQEGYIRLQSAKGKGASFYVYIPAGDRKPPAGISEINEEKGD